MKKIDIGSTRLGIFLVSAYIAMAAIREVYFAVTLRQVNIFVLITLVFAMAAIVFTAIQGANLKSIYAKVKNNWIDIIGINVTTAMAWFTFIFSLQFIEPAVSTSIVTALGPVSTLIVGIKILKNFHPRKIDIICAVGIFISIILLGYFTLTGKSGVKTDSTILTFIGLLCAAICGFSSAANTVVTKRLIIGGFQSSEIMVVRFYLLIGGSVLWILISRISVHMTAHQFASVATISFLGISIPLYLLQLGISKVDVNSVALIISMGPIITFITQAIHGGFFVSPYSLFGITLTLAFVFTGVISKFRNQGRA